MPKIQLNNTSFSIILILDQGGDEVFKYPISFLVLILISTPTSRTSRDYDSAMIDKSRFYCQGKKQAGRNRGLFDDACPAR
jgi:hypothetical protein